MSDFDALPYVPLDRQRFLSEIRNNESFDAVIVGGGIAGAATLRELSAQGFRVALIERGDFANGASSALTRVAQGGFRYLERGEIGLVRRAVTERNRFVAAAPHQTRPIRVVLPTETLFAGAFNALLRALRLTGGHSLPGALPLRLGVALYDALSARTRILPRGGFFSRRELQRRYPGIAARFAGAAYEFEALIASPERVAIELLEDAALEDAGAVAINYAELKIDDGALRLVDKLSGEILALQTRVVVNAAGANVDKVARSFGVTTPLVDGVAGTHLLLDAPRVAAALGEDLLFFEDGVTERSRRRLCCVYAVGENILLGATEAPVADADASRPTVAEDDYLIAALNRLFPGETIGPERIVARLHGVRPLAAASEGDVTGRSRDHVIHRHSAFGGRLTLISIAGGKWTTFRAIGEDAAQAVAAALGHVPEKGEPVRPIGGGGKFPADPAGREEAAAFLICRFGIGGGLAERLIAAYGGRAGRIAAYLSAPDARAPLCGGALTAGEIKFFVREEMATTADDIARRRTRLFFEGRATPEALREIETALAAVARREPAGVVV